MTAKSAASVFAVLFQSILLSPLCADSPAVHGLPRDLPLAFEANQGQTDSSVRFLARGPGFAFFLTRDGAVLSLADGSRRAVVRIQPHGMRPVRIEGLEPLPARSHYLIGSDPAHWRRNVPMFARVRYGGVYPGIDLVFYGNQRQLEFDFVVAPGADPSAIRLDFQGADDLYLDSGGSLVLKTGAGEIRQPRPRVFQQHGDELREVRSEYVLRGPFRAGFQVAPYDRTKPLRIDPVLVYSSFLGGNAGTQGGGDYGRAIAIDPAGNIYVAGMTESSSFPTSQGALLNHMSPGPRMDAFVAKVDPSGTSLLYSTYLGGNGNDDANSIAVDAAGNAVVAGYTNSDDFPTTPGAIQPKRSGATDAFVAKLNSSGSKLVFSTLLGGSSDDSANAVALDAAGAVYLAGVTSSGNFPVSPGSYQSSRKGGQDAFVAKLSPAADAILYSTYLGGAANDAATAIAVGPSGEAVTAGWTDSPDFPLTPGAFRSTRAGREAFVAKLPVSGSLAMSTLAGGSGDDTATAVAVNASGDVFVAGYTSSRDFTITKPAVALAPSGSPLSGVLLLQDIAQQLRAGAYQGGASDGFLLKIQGDGTSLLFGRYLGGSGSDSATALALDSAGNVIVAGKTDSTDFPVSPQAAQSGYGGGLSDGFAARFSGTDGSRLLVTYAGGRGDDVILAVAADSSSGFAAAGYTASDNLAAGSTFQRSLQPGGYDAFIRKWDASGALSWSSYLGGGGYSTNEQALDMAVDAAGNVYVAGMTASTDFPATAGAIQQTAGGSPFLDAFVTKIDPTGAKVLYSTYLGGSRDDFAKGIAVDSSGNAYVAGGTSSPNFPTTSAAFQPNFSGSSDAFVAKLNPQGDTLVYSTLLGGPITAQASGIAVDNAGNAYVAGYGFLPQFPATSGAVQVPGGSEDVFVAKLSPDGARLVYSAVLGGESIDRSRRIAIDTAGNAYVTGLTWSSHFPVTTGAYQPANRGGIDAFLLKLNPDASSLVYSTYLGGSGYDEALALAVDGAGGAVVGGYSDSANFPVTAGTIQQSNKGAYDGFVTRFTADGTQISSSTLLGGRSEDGVSALALAADGRVFVTGWSYSQDLPATQKAMQDGNAGGSDAFLAVLNPGLTSLDFCTALGGRGDDRGSAIAVDASGAVFLAGYTASADFPAAAGAFQPAMGGPQNSFVSKVDLAGSSTIPKPVITRVVNYYSNQPSQAAGMIASIEGTGLATGTAQIAQPMQKYSGTLPNSIAGTSVKVSQSAASLFSVSPTRIVAQLPYTGMMQFTVTVQGQTSTMFTGSFGTAVVGVAAVYKQDLSSITQDSPAKPGDTVIAYIAGAGDTTPASVAGTPAPDSPVFNANQTFAAQVETDEPGQGHIRMMCTVKSVRMVPGLIGIAQAQVVISPEISADSINWDFSINQSNKVRIYIKSAAAP